MRKGECLISATYRQIGASATNQRKRKSTLFMTRRQPAPPAKTGLMSKVKTLFSSRKEMTKTTPEGEEARQEKMTQIRDQGSGTN